MSLGKESEIATTSYVWDIENFAALAKLVVPGKVLQSPVFNKKCIENAWKFHIYPNGKSNEDYIGFYLHRSKNSSDQTKYSYTLSIGRPEAKPIESHKYLGTCMDNAIGDELFLQKKSNSWILRGGVRFQCDITKVDQTSHLLTNTPEFYRDLPDIENLSLDLQQLLEVPFDSDLTMKMGEKEVYLHKCILLARCPSLGVEFGYSGIIEMPPSIETEINYETFEPLMHYIYTGKLKESRASLEMFHLAEKWKIPSFMRCFYENPTNYHIYSATNQETQIINWNLDELNFWEKDSSTSVHILPTTSLYTKQLAIQVSVSDGGDGEKSIDFSFRFFGFQESQPILLNCKISLTFKSGILAFKEEEHVFVQDEHWHFPRFLSLSDKQHSRMLLSAELSMTDGTKLLTTKGHQTSTKLYTDSQIATNNLEHLHDNMHFLLQTGGRTRNLILLSSDNRRFSVHKAVMWARWPGMKKILESPSDSSADENSTALQKIQLKLHSSILLILISYFYTGSFTSMNREKAEDLLKYSKFVEYPVHLVQKCQAFLSDSQ